MADSGKRLRISVEELRALLDGAVKAIEETHGPDIELDADYYWWIPNPDVYDPTTQPTDLTLGRFSDELEFLHNGAKGDYVLSYNAVWLSQLLRAIGEKPIRDVGWLAAPRLMCGRTRSQDSPRKMLTMSTAAWHLPLGQAGVLRRQLIQNGSVFHVPRP